MENKLKFYMVIGVGVASICYALLLWWRLKRSSSWPSTDGKIVYSAKITARHNFQKVEKVVIRYTYFAGCRYESDAVKVGGFIHLRKRDENELLQKYPLGRAVQVYYYPDRPQVACLEKRGIDSILIIGGYGCIALIIGISLLIF
jgi:hypothetical protein